MKKEGLKKIKAGERETNNRKIKKDKATFGIQGLPFVEIGKEKSA